MTNNFHIRLFLKSCANYGFDCTYLICTNVDWLPVIVRLLSFPCSMFILSLIWTQNRFTTCVKDIHSFWGLCLQPFLKHFTFYGWSWILYCYYLCLWYCVVIFIWICILFLHSMLKSMLFSPYYLHGLVFICFLQKYWNTSYWVIFNICILHAFAYNDEICHLCMWYSVTCTHYLRLYLNQ